MRRRRPSVVASLLVAAALLLGCRGDREAERRASAQATAEAEERAQEATVTSAMLEQKSSAAEQDASEASLRANNEMIAAFRLEQSDFRGRLERSLDVLDHQILRAPRGAAFARTGQPERGDERLRDLRARRDLLKTDLDAVNRSTEPDWATLRTKVDQDLAKGRPGARCRPEITLAANETLGSASDAFGARQHECGKTGLCAAANRPENRKTAPV